jgi:predicted PurR-regulated permease PerM
MNDVDDARRGSGIEARNTDRRSYARERVPIAIGIAVVFFFLYLVQAILLPFLLGAIVGFLAAPLLNLLARRTGLPRTLFASLLFVLIAAVLAAAAFVVVPRALHEITSLVADAEPTLATMARQIIGDHPTPVLGGSLDPDAIAHGAVAALRDRLSQVATLATLAEWGIAGLFGLFLSLVLLFYFLAGAQQIGSGLLWLIPPHHRAAAMEVWRRLDPVLRRYFIGVILVVIYASIAAYCGLGLILGIRHAVLLAIMTGFLEMIPVIGPLTSAVVAGLVAVRYATGIGNLIGYAVYATILRLSIDELVGPVVLGRAAHVHPVLVIFCFLSGGVLFGVAGVIMAMPVALAIKYTLAVLYDEPA